MFSLRFNLAILSCVIFVIFISTYFHYDFPLPQLLAGLHDNQNGLIFSRSILGVIASSVFILLASLLGTLSCLLLMLSSKSSYKKLFFQNLFIFFAFFIIVGVITIIQGFST
ncbi:hypothetical protein PP2015_2251 [Pseudoalteromonas phenolica]|uniref:Uncharacterized protein n=1 Tax=Pseudoalteromonas phenolica TaxID=161398 RepID=A0A0S2K340_9GAMM|nr:hypothetical protein PP2015_2251 [Pseudoalteromonas phenolica]MBE0356143.1 hypothetical protein [Pseudoalteromonas phenolica O-BC30]